MALHYILDGYNIIKRAEPWANKSLRMGREALIHMIEVRRPQGSVKNKVTIVFDGQPGMVDESKATLATIVFTSGQTADDKIKGIVAASHHKKNIVVVTDDKDIRFHVRALGAKILGCGDFLKANSVAGHETYEPSLGKKANLHLKRIDRNTERKINQEFEKIWLKRK